MSMSIRTRSWIVLASSATLTLSSASIATAEDDPPPTEPAAEEAAVEWPPADTDGEWLPLPDELFAEPTLVTACDSTVTVTTGDVAEVEYQAMHQSDGTIRVEYRGATTVDLVRESDGAMLDEVDNGGAGAEIYGADGTTVVFSFDGPGIFYSYDEVEAAVFAAQGLPSFFSYDSGNFTERVVFPDDPEALTIVSAEVITDTARGVSDICDLLDRAARDQH